MFNSDEWYDKGIPQTISDMKRRHGIKQDAKKTINTLYNVTPENKQILGSTDLEKLRREVTNTKWISSTAQTELLNKLTTLKDVKANNIKNAFEDYVEQQLTYHDVSDKIDKNIDYFIFDNTTSSFINIGKFLNTYDDKHGVRDTDLSPIRYYVFKEKTIFVNDLKSAEIYKLKTPPPPPPTEHVVIQDAGRRTRRRKTRRPKRSRRRTNRKARKSRRRR